MNSLLSPQTLARDLGARSATAQEGIAALYGALAGNPPAARDAQTQWESLVGDALGHATGRRADGLRSLAKCYRLSVAPLDPRALLLAVHTYYAILVKLLVWQAAARAFGLPAPARRFVETRGSEPLRRAVDEWEQGAMGERPDLWALFRPDPFVWHLAAWDEPLARWIGNLAGRIDASGWPPCGQGDGAARDWFKDLYPALFPQGLRHALGQYYTPDWLAQHVLDTVGYRGQPDRRVLDPACGSGTFLVEAIRRIRQASGSRPARASAELCREILASVVGFDLDPLAAATARANYLLAVCDLLPAARDVAIPVHLRDLILPAEPGDLPEPAFDYVVGNPPWIAWDHLPEPYRQATKPLWQRYGLFSLSGTAARHGGGKKDLAMLMLYVAADRHLKDGGRLGLVMTQTPLQSKGAGDGFRRFRLGDSGVWLRVHEVHDMADFRPFPGAANWTCTMFIEKGRPTVYPVPYVRWSLDGPAPAGPDAGPPAFRRRPCEAEPIDPARPTSPWLVRAQGLGLAIDRLIGPSDYQAHLGANSGGANGVYWLRVLGPADGGLLVRNGVGRAKRDAEVVEHALERELLFPLLRWGDVARYRARCAAHVLLAQDVDTRHGIDRATLEEKYPNAARYLSRFQAILEGRAAYRRYQQESAFWSMYDVGPYTVAPIKVVWRRMDRRINAAVAGPADDPWLGLRPVVPQETCVLSPTETLDEAHYVCAVMNSAVVGFLVRAHSVRGGKGFGTPSILDFLRVRRFDPADDRHLQLAAWSRQSHDLAGRGEDCLDVQHRIDRLAGELWGLDTGQVRSLSDDC